MSKYIDWRNKSKRFAYVNSFFPRAHDVLDSLARAAFGAGKREGMKLASSLISNNVNHDKEILKLAIDALEEIHHAKRSGFQQYVLNGLRDELEDKESKINIDPAMTILEFIKIIIHRQWLKLDGRATFYPVDGADPAVCMVRSRTEKLLLKAVSFCLDLVEAIFKVFLHLINIALSIVYFLSINLKSAHKKAPN